MGWAVVQYDMQIQLGRSDMVGLTKVVQELFGSVLLGEASDDFAGQNTKGGWSCHKHSTFNGGATGERSEQSEQPD